MCGRCEELEEEVTQLKARLYGYGWEPPADLKLTGHETVILQALMAHDRVIPTWSLYEASRLAPNARDANAGREIVQVRICQTRKKLAPFGIEIETIHARGYRITGESRARLLNWHADHAEAA